jgi:hypothetical protein
MAVLEKNIGQLFNLNVGPLVGGEKSVAWLQHDNFAFYMPGYGILVNGTHLPPYLSAQR